MGQLSFTEADYSKRNKRTKREEFLDQMDGFIPWKEWIEIIRPYYYQNTRGRKAKDIETMLRMYLMQNWFSLSDEGIEDGFYMKKSKTFIDQIDYALAEHYGFTEEELDYIINYDIKYRMGIGTNDGDE